MNVTAGPQRQQDNAPFLHDTCEEQAMAWSLQEAGKTQVNKGQATLFPSHSGNTKHGRQPGYVQYTIGQLPGPLLGVLFQK